MINKFNCGICKGKTTSRKGLREHLKKEHRILKNIANNDHEIKQRQDWWLVQEWE